MSITDELRTWAARELAGWKMARERFDALTAIADRIDAEHEEAIQQALMGEGGVPATDENMAELGWIRLPKDVDGVPIRVGDVMKGEKIGGGFCEPFEVIGYIMSNGELEPMDEHKLPRKRKYAHHHVPDTWERIIRDAIGEGMARQRNNDSGEYCERANPMNNDALVARCRALAGDAS